MNKAGVIEFMNKRATQLAMLSVVFVGMMLFLAPSLIEEAQARITASVTSDKPMKGGASDRLYSGVWVDAPVIHDGGLTMSWISAGEIGDGNEKGWVGVYIGNWDKIGMGFENPAKGENTCYINNSNSNQEIYDVSCTITQGNFAKVTYEIHTKDKIHTKHK